MTTKKTQVKPIVATQQEGPSVAIMTRVPTPVNEKVETWARLNYISRSAFVARAVVDYIRRLETDQFTGSVQSQN